MAEAEAAAARYTIATAQVGWARWAVGSGQFTTTGIDNMACAKARFLLPAPYHDTRHEIGNVSTG